MCNCFRSISAQVRSSIQSLQDVSSNEKIRHFTYRKLNLATNNFHPSNRIGRGGFGIVYKGTLDDGRAVAVKVLLVQSRQGHREFAAEIDAMARARHPNLVELVGCCTQNGHRILVYEYAGNGSLDRVLSDASLDWETRSSICRGTARGLAFLHERLKPHIVHRDIKASNVLLGPGFRPKIGDFGLAKLFPDDITHISTRVAGTTGYLAPEYALGGQLTMKADVYSFGVLVLEVVSGGGVHRQQVLVQRAWELFVEGRLLELTDAELKSYPSDEVCRYLKVALFCTQASPARRPLMSQVLQMLSSTDIPLNEEHITTPGFFCLPDVLSSDNNKPSASTSSASTTTLTDFVPR